MRLVRWVTSKVYGPLPQSCIPQKQNYYQGALSMDSSNELLSAGETVWARPSHEIMILNSSFPALPLIPYTTSPLPPGPGLLIN